MKKILLSLLLAPALLFSQEDLLSEIDIKETSTSSLPWVAISGKNKPTSAPINMLVKIQMVKFWRI